MTDTKNPWLRQVKLFVGPLEEWRGGGNQKQAVIFEGDGTTEKLRIRFEIRKSILSIPQPSQIYIYNLGSAVRKSLQSGTANLEKIQERPGANIELKVGWENIPLSTIFRGTLFGCLSEREGPDIITMLSCLAGFGGTSKTIVSQTWSGGTKLSSIVRTLAEKIPGVSIGTIDITEYTIGNQGLSDCAMVQTWLDNLARTYGFSWWIDKGSFYAVDDQRPLIGKEVSISYKNGVLLRAEPMLVGPYSKQNGVSIHSLLDPKIEVGYKVKLESSVNPNINGSWKVHTMTQTGDTHSSEWFCYIDSFWTSS